jgi:hypothetical protein
MRQAGVAVHRELVLQAPRESWHERRGVARELPQPGGDGDPRVQRPSNGVAELPCREVRDLVLGVVQREVEARL